MYGYPVDASSSFHFARDNIKSYIFFCTYSSMETIVISSGWFLLVLLTILYQLEIKMINK